MRNLALFSIMISTIILIALCFMTDVNATYYIIQEDISAQLEERYTVEDEITEKNLAKNKEIIKNICDSVYEIQDINFQIIMSKHSFKEIQSVTSPRKNKKNQYTIVIANETSVNLERTILHELGHIFQFAKINIRGYQQICYPQGFKNDSWASYNKNQLERENFAEDFVQYITDGKYEKRTKTVYSKKFKYIMRRFRRRE